MLDSKALKALPRRVSIDCEEKSPTYLGKIAQTISQAFRSYLYYPVDSFFSRTYERVSRSLAFAKHGYMHYDFESAYIYDLMAFKMKRVYKCLKNGYGVQKKEDMRALKEAIKICERLFHGNYDDKYHEAHNKKWGNIRSKHIPRRFDEKGKVTHYEWKTWRPKVKTVAQKEKERAEFLQTWQDGEKDRLADLDRLNEILKKHQMAWWD